MKPIAALTLAILGMASVGFSQEKTVSKSIPNIPMLNWGKSGETTFCGALSVALKPMGIDRSYTELLGDSSLAFRVRWWKPATGNGWCPASPVGEMFPWTDRAAASAGVKLKFKGDLGGKSDLADLAKTIKENIDAGRPLLAYVTAFDVGVIYGYEDSGNRVLARDYFIKDEKAVFPLNETKTFIGVLTTGDKPVDANERAKEAIKNAITDWTAKPEDFPNNGVAGQFQLGDAAYEQWINDLKNANTFTDEERSKMFHPHWWTFDVLADNRMNAVGYLKGVEASFNDETRPLIAEAIRHYEKSADLLGSCFKNKDAFLGPWSGKKIDDWTSDVRKREIEILSQVRASDNAAIEQLKLAAGKF